MWINTSISAYREDKTASRAGDVKRVGGCQGGFIGSSPCAQAVDLLGAPGSLAARSLAGARRQPRPQRDGPQDLADRQRGSIALSRGGGQATGCFPGGT